MLLSNEQIEQLKRKLQSLASEETWDDVEDFCAVDMVGSNVDDAYYGGKRDGEIDFARQLLFQLFGE